MTQARKTVLLVVSIGVLSVMLSVPAVALNPDHLAQGGCAICHNLHNAPGQALTNEGSSEVLCLSCHGPGGIATKTVSIHTNKPGSSYAPFTMTCVDCHNTHDNPDNVKGGVNLAMVGPNVSPDRLAKIDTPNSGTKYVVFESRGTDVGGASARSFADGDEDGDGVYDGVCEVCHTQTQFHRNNPSGDHSHNTGSTCTQCHPHDKNFRGEGGCTLCHASPQDNGDGVPVGGRRAIVGEFSYTSHHVMGQLNDGDCVVCHDQSQHQGGTVRLLNVDTGAVITLTGNPTGDSIEAAKLNQFCLACHDADGAGGSAPFSDGQMPPLIDATKWTNHASHDLANISCFGNGTFGCHASGHGSQKIKLLAPYGTPATGPLYAEEEEGFCLNCHNGTIGADIETPIGQTGSAHGVDQQGGIHDHDEDYAATATHVECLDCHNPHTNTGAAASAPAVKGELNDTRGMDFAGTQKDPAAYEYEVCLKCHGLDSYIVTTPKDEEIATGNIAVAMDPANASYHPVGAVGKSSRVPSLRSGWTTGSRIYCQDCHNKSASVSGGEGPHGSSWDFILERQYVTDSYQTYSTAKYDLCFKCHDPNVILDENRRDGFEEHFLHVVEERASCSVCHDPHGVPGRTALINFDLRYCTSVNGRLEFGLSSDGSRGYCYVRCHGKRHRPKWYDRQ